MDFKIQALSNIFAKLPQIKFSIRLSILSIVLSLLVGMTVLVIGINYFAINSVLIASAKNSLSQSSARVAEQVKSYLQPLNSNVLTAYNLLHQGVVQPQHPEFGMFLYSLIVDNKNIVAAYFGDVHGNMYWLNREGDRFFLDIILRDKYGSVAQANRASFNSDGAFLGKKSTDNRFDPRLRPWYQQAVAKKALTWVVYQFFPIGAQEQQFGVTSSFPVYDERGKLQGVFGVDMLLGTIAQYVKNIKLTPNSFIFVAELNGDVIAAHALDGKLLTFKEVPDIDDIKAPWLKKSHAIYLEKRVSPFVYSSEGKEYIAAYERIFGVKSDYPWYIAIVTPIRDIIDPLLKNVLLNFILVFVALIGGIFFASIFSSSLSKPIRKLAEDANFICKLKLESVSYLLSRIKEISDMTEAFAKMKNALYSFQRYMPVTLVRKLIVSNKVATVGGESRELTLLFSDIQDFTQLSEAFKPEELMQYLSEYFQVITKVIIDAYGTVDKYVGDGVMAFWGAPLDDDNHALHACQAVLQAQQDLYKLNLKWRLENKPELKTRFGLNSGRVIVGNVGSDDRLSYTSLGDPVNLASRLEGLNKIYGTTIIVSESVYRKVKDQFKLRLLDRVAVKGRKQGVCIYELIEERSAQKGLRDEQYERDFNQAFASYGYGDWVGALNLFKILSSKYPNDAVVKIFIERCKHFIANPPVNWDGVWTVDEK